MGKTDPAWRRVTRVYAREDGSYLISLHVTINDTSETRVYGDTIVTTTTGQSDVVSPEQAEQARSIEDE